MNTLSLKANAVPAQPVQAAKPALMPGQAVKIIYDNWPPFRAAVRTFRECVDSRRPFSREDAQAMEAVMQMTEGQRNRETYAHYIIDLAYSEYVRHVEAIDKAAFVTRSYEVWLMATHQWIPAGELVRMVAN